MNRFEDGDERKYEGESGGGGRTVGEGADITYTAICPSCDRRENDLPSEHHAQAWLTGHIQAEHADELPAFEGTGDPA
jgi:hypothetical protein